VVVLGLHVAGDRAVAFLAFVAPGFEIAPNAALRPRAAPAGEP
jgi:hypothetical protein